MTITDSPVSSFDPATLDTVDFCEPRTYDDPWVVFAAVRDLDTLHYDAKNDLYIAARHEDVFHISRDNELYCSRFGVRPIIAGDMSIITLDGDEHVRTRRLINTGFTPRRVRDLMPRVRDLTNQIIDEIADAGQVEFVEQFAIHVPLIIICELMGLNPDQRMSMYRWSDDMMAGDGRSAADDPVLHSAAVAFGEFATMCLELIAERRTDPQNDLISVLTQAFDDGALTRDKQNTQGVDNETMDKLRETHGTLNDDELLAFLAVLLVAGNETTRNAISGGMLALSMFPEQKQLLLDNLDIDDFMDTAVDELIRYVSPVLGFIRTVTAEHTYRNTSLNEGDRILMLYGAANRDERAIDQPNDLNLQRDPNPHLAFGIGPHFCLGANLARMEVKLVFQELLQRLPDIVIDDNAPFVRGESSLVLALQHLPASFSTSAGFGCPVAH